MAPTRKKPSVALSQVPSVRDLCNRLGFERATQAETTVFTDTTHVFRKSYKCSNGAAGSTLTDWNSPAVQQELNAMAMQYLDEGGNGERFWSESRRWKDDSDLMYPEDKKQIADYLMQLFWKQNKYSLNNQNYIERKVSAAHDHFRDRTTPTQESTQRASIASTATLKPVDMQERRFPEWEANPQRIEARGPVVSLLDDDDRNELLDQMQSALPKNARLVGGGDIFEVPEDDSDAARNPPTTGHAIHRPLIQTPTKKPTNQGPEKSAGAKKTSGVSPVSNRPRIGEKAKGKIQKKRKLISPRRISERPKAPREMPGLVSNEILDDILSREPSAKSPPSEAEHHPLRTSDQRRRVATTDTVHNFLEASVNNTNMQTGTSSERQDGQLLHGSGIEAQEPYIPTAPMLSANSVTSSGSRPSRTFDMPTPVSEPEVNVRHPSDSSLTPDPTTNPRPKVRGMFWIVTSPEPNYSEESWNNGQIKGKSLSTVIKEVSSITNREAILKLKIKLRTPFAQTTTTVHKDAKDHWEIAKHNLEVKIKEAFARDKSRPIHFQIWIEPVYEDSVPLGTMEDVENGEIDW